MKATYFQTIFLVPCGILYIFILTSSCNGPNEKNSGSISPDSSTQDSIRKVHRVDSLSKRLNAINFEALYRYEYSIDFDSILNKRVFITDYRLKDIQKVNNSYFIKISIWERAQVRLNIDSTYLDGLRKIDVDNPPVLVFQISKVKKIDFEVTATVDDDNDDSDQNEEKNASLEMDTETGKYFVIYGELLSIARK